MYHFFLLQFSSSLLYMESWDEEVFKALNIMFLDFLPDDFRK